MYFWCKIIKMDTFIQSTEKWRWTLKISYKNSLDKRGSSSLQRFSEGNPFFNFLPRALLVWKNITHHKYKRFTVCYFLLLKHLSSHEYGYFLKPFNKHVWQMDALKTVDSYCTELCNTKQIEPLLPNCTIV